MANSHENRLLAALPRPAFEALACRLTVGSFGTGTILVEAEREIERIYFPLRGVVSLLMQTSVGEGIATGMVGREGVIGAMAGLGYQPSEVQAVIHIPMLAASISVRDFRKAIAEHDAIRELCIAFNEDLLNQARRTVVCNALHLIGQRLSSRLLQALDRSEGDTLPMTHVVLADMLGVRRTSITEAASKLQDNGAISYTRGKIRIRDRTALEHLACDCYVRLSQRSMIPHVRQNRPWGVTT